MQLTGGAGAPFIGKAASLLRGVEVAKDNVTKARHEGHELCAACVPSPRGPVFTTLIDKAVGKGMTTRTWTTVNNAPQLELKRHAQTRLQRPQRTLTVAQHTLKNNPS